MIILVYLQRCVCSRRGDSWRESGLVRWDDISRFDYVRCVTRGWMLDVVLVELSVVIGLGGRPESCVVSLELLVVEA